jgi:hypothetical protein
MLIWATLFERPLSLIAQQYRGETVSFISAGFCPKLDTFAALLQAGRITHPQSFSIFCSPFWGEMTISSLGHLPFK